MGDVIYNCIECSGEIPEDRLGTSRFCSIICKNSFIGESIYRKPTSIPSRERTDITKRLKAQRRAKGGTDERLCDWCKTPFKPYNSKTYFCSPTCSVAFHAQPKRKSPFK